MGLLSFRPRTINVYRIYYNHRTEPRITLLSWQWYLTKWQGGGEIVHMIMSWYHNIIAVVYEIYLSLSKDWNTDAKYYGLLWLLVAVNFMLQPARCGLGHSSNLREKKLDRKEHNQRKTSKNFQAIATKNCQRRDNLKKVCTTASLTDVTSLTEMLFHQLWNSPLKQKIQRKKHCKINK